MKLPIEIPGLDKSGYKMLDKEKQIIELLKNNSNWEYDKRGKEEYFTIKINGRVINTSHVIIFIATDLDCSNCKIELFIDHIPSKIRNEFICNLANLLQNKKLKIQKEKYESTYDNLIYMLSSKF